MIAALPAAVLAQVDRSRAGAATPQTFAERYALVSPDPDNLRWVTDPAGSGRTVLESRVRKNDEKVWGGYRAEIAAHKEYVREGVRWYAMSVYFPATWQFHAYPVVVAQLHTSQKKALVSPPLAFLAQGENLDLELYASHRPTENGETTRSNAARQTIRLDRIHTGQWYCFVVRADWATQPGNGSMKVWMNGEKVYEAANLYNSYETWLGNYPRAGLYVPGMMGVDERTLYIDFIHVGGPRSGYEEMAALTPCAGHVGGGRKQ